MNYNTDWKAIQQRFLPSKSVHQVKHFSTRFLLVWWWRNIGMSWFWDRWWLEYFVQVEQRLFVYPMLLVLKFPVGWDNLWICLTWDWQLCFVIGLHHLLVERPATCLLRMWLFWRNYPKFVKPLQKCHNNCGHVLLLWSAKICVVARWLYGPGHESGGAYTGFYTLMESLLCKKELLSIGHWCGRLKCSL